MSSSSFRFSLTMPVNNSGIRVLPISWETNRLCQTPPKKSAMAAKRHVPLPTQRVQEQSGGLLAGEILLPANEIPVADGKAAPEARPHEVCTDLLQLVLDTPRHNVPIPG